MAGLSHTRTIRSHQSHLRNDIRVLHDDGLSRYDRSWLKVRRSREPWTIVFEEIDLLHYVIFNLKKRGGAKDRKGVKVER